jgi:hypothetical protein
MRSLDFAYLFVPILTSLVASGLSAEESANGFHDTDRARRLLAIARDYLPADWRYPVTDRRLSSALEREVARLLPVRVRRQPNEFTCGPTSLGVLLSYYGRPLGDEELGRATRVTEDGVDPEQLVGAAKRFGFDVSAGYGRSVADIIGAMRSQQPVIIDYQASYDETDPPEEGYGHYSVVVASDSRDFLIIDCSATNPHHLRRIPRDRLARIWWDEFIDRARRPNRFERWMMTVRPKQMQRPREITQMVIGLIGVGAAE